MFGSALFLWLGVEVILHTITKCIWDPSPSSRGGNGLCPHTLAYSASLDYKTYKQQQVGKDFSLFSYFLWWAVRQKGISALKSFQSRKSPPRRGSFPSFCGTGVDLCLGHTVASLGEGITCFPLGKHKGYFLSISSPRFKSFRVSNTNAVEPDTCHF